ncbi:uncharacterized protein LOC102357094 [Latimeria chalumnae]|uniref:uncharacterized protein LOC102357094 n=1 Tax=Latimeria chalumnae TaxID=7897 RepID=UPI00313C6817
MDWQLLLLLLVAAGNSIPETWMKRQRCPDICKLQSQKRISSVCKGCNGGVSRDRREAADTNSSIYVEKSCEYDFPCYAAGGGKEQCEHAVGHPENLVAVPGNSSQCATEYDNAMVEWNPSPYGISFLQGFFVHVRDIEGVGQHSECKEIVLKKGQKLQPKDIKMVFKTTFCLPLDTTYIIKIYGYPIPPGRENESNITADVRYKARSGWMTKNITVTQVGYSLTVTFEQAPDNYGIRSYRVEYQGDGAAVSRHRNSVTVMHQFRATTSQVTFNNLLPGCNYTVMVSASFEGSAVTQVTYVLQPGLEFRFSKTQ